MAKLKLSPQRIESLLFDHKNGMKVTALKKKYHIERCTVYEYLKRAETDLDSREEPEEHEVVSRKDTYKCDCVLCGSITELEEREDVKHQPSFICSADCFERLSKGERKKEGYLHGEREIENAIKHHIKFFPKKWIELEDDDEDALIDE